MHDTFLIVVTSLNVLISAFNVANIVRSRRSIRRMEQQRKQWYDPAPRWEEGN